MITSIQLRCPPRIERTGMRQRGMPQYGRRFVIAAKRGSLCGLHPSKPGSVGSIVHRSRERDSKIDSIICLRRARIV